MIHIENKDYHFIKHLLPQLKGKVLRCKNCHYFVLKGNTCPICYNTDESNYEEYDTDKLFNNVTRYIHSLDEFREDAIDNNTKNNIENTIKLGYEFISFSECDDYEMTSYWYKGHLEKEDIANIVREIAFNGLKDISVEVDRIDYRYLKVKNRNENKIIPITEISFIGPWIYKAF